MIGQGNFVSTKSGSVQVNGAVFVAKTRDSAGLFFPLWSFFYNQRGGGSPAGITTVAVGFLPKLGLYTNANPRAAKLYRILFREITPP